MSKRHEKTRIGWTEFVDLPEWGIEGLKAKIDTGARTSALHVTDLEPVDSEHVRFHVVLSRDHNRQVAVRARVVKYARVRSSSGHYTRRCFVETPVKIGPVVKPIEISLVCRQKMLFRMILGRKALEHDFTVDVGHRNLLGKPPKRRGKKKKTV